RKVDRSVSGAYRELRARVSRQHSFRKGGCHGHARQKKDRGQAGQENRRIKTVRGTASLPDLREAGTGYHLRALQARRAGGSPGRKTQGRKRRRRASRKIP